MWNDETYRRLQADLRGRRDEKFLKFHQGLVPGTANIIGVPVPVLRSIAKEIAAGDPEGYLSVAGTGAYEEILLQGLVIGYMKPEESRFFALLADFVPKIDNWAVCDYVCAGLKMVNKYHSQTFLWLQPYLESSSEFAVRFAVVLLMDYYCTGAYIDRILPIFTHVRHEGYYVQMAVAWALSVCFIRFREKTLAVFVSGALPAFTCRKALQKCMESRRVSEEDKAMLRELKKRKDGIKMDFQQLLATRESVRSYLEKPVEREQLVGMVEDAMLSPSACNSQPWKFIIVDEEEKKQAVRPFLKDEALRLNRHVDKAPAFIAVCETPANLSILGDGAYSQKYAQMDIGIAVQTLCLSAVSRGLATCIMGGMHDEGIKGALGIPQDVPLRLMVAVGYNKHNHPRKKTRKPLEECLSFNEW